MEKCITVRYGHGKKVKKKKRKEIEIVFFPEKNYFLKSGRVWEVLATIGYEIQEEFLRW